MSAQETREKNRRRARTMRATQPVCAMISKMLPMKMAEKKKIMSAPQEKRNFTDKSNVAHAWNVVKTIEMRVCGKSLPRRHGEDREKRNEREERERKKQKSQRRDAEIRGEDLGTEDCNVRA